MFGVQFAPQGCFNGYYHIILKIATIIL